jgi:hypothetical protein
MGRTACTEPQCLYRGDLYLYLYLCLTGCGFDIRSVTIQSEHMLRIQGFVLEGGEWGATCDLT